MADNVKFFCLFYCDFHATGNFFFGLCKCPNDWTVQALSSNKVIFKDLLFANFITCSKGRHFKILNMVSVLWQCSKLMLRKFFFFFMMRPYFLLRIFFLHTWTHTSVSQILFKGQVIPFHNQQNQ